MSNPVEKVTKPHKNEKIDYLLHEVKIDEFSSEKVVEDYFYKNISDMMDTIFNEKIFFYKRQMKINGQPYLIKGMSGGLTRSFKCRARFDIYVECESGNNYVLEFKNPKKKLGHESLSVITQLLYYSVVFPKTNKFVIVSTKYIDGLNEVVSKYKLPIDFVLFNKGQCFLLQK